MLTEAVLHEVFRWFGPLGSLDPPARERLRRVAEPFTLARGGLAFDEGTPCTALLLLTAGRVNVVRPGPRGREILLYRVDPGQSCVLTLHCLLQGVRYPARGVAASTCHGVTLPREFFFELLDRERDVRDLVLRSVSSRVVELMDLVEQVAFNRLDERLAGWLLARRGKEPGEAIRCTHQEIADELGSVREIVSRILGSFADRGVVSLERGQVRIEDVAGLEAISRPA